MIYSKITGLVNTPIGRMETPIKMLIEYESDLMKKKGGICDWLFNVEKSSRFGETIVGQTDFDLFKPTAEGEAAENDTIVETYSKFIEHIQFTKEFIITAEMMEDAQFGIAAEAKRRIQSFTRSYYKTRNRLCESVLTSGSSTSGSFCGSLIDTTAPDGMPLFYHEHSWGNYSASVYGLQSNSFHGNLFRESLDDDAPYSVARIEAAIYALASKIRNMKDDNGDPLGYTADTIILPGNKPTLEAIVKRICGSEYMPGSASNDINLHYGNWNIVILPSWAPSDDRLMVMSSEANKVLGGNMFFERIPLTISNWVDHHTGNYIWNGRCRFGVGFGSYRHIVLGVEGESVTKSEFLSVN